MYRKSHKRECNSGFMGTNDALKKIEIARAVGEVTCSGSDGDVPPSLLKPDPV